MPLPPTVNVKRAWAGGATEALKAVVEGLQHITQFVVNVNPANIVAGAEVDTVVAVPAAEGVKNGDTILCIVPAALNAGVYLRRCFANADNSITITLRNETAGAIDPAAADYRFIRLMNERFVIL